MKGRHSERGFSLAEAVIAIVILGFMGTLVFGTLARAMTGREEAERITSHYHQVRQGMLRMAREIQMAFLTDHRDCDDPRTKTIFKGQDGRLDFTSFSHYKITADANESDQNELGYFIGPHPDDSQRQALIRREQVRIDDEPEEGGVEQVLAEDITELAFEFYDAKEDRWEDEWDTTDRDYKDRLPMFVTIRLKAKSIYEREKDDEFITKTRIFLKKPLRIVGTGFARCVD